MKLIYDHIAVGSYVDYQRVVQVTKEGNPVPDTFRVKIHSDASYHFQSTAVVEVWLAMPGWVEVHRPHPLSISGQVWDSMSRYGDSSGATKVAKALADDLLKVAFKIVGVKS